MTWFTTKVFNPVIEFIFSCRLSLFVCLLWTDLFIDLPIYIILIYLFTALIFFHCFSFWVLVLLASLLFHFCFHWFADLDYTDLFIHCTDFFFIASVFEFLSYLLLSYSIFVFISCFLDLVFHSFCPINTSLVLFAFPFPKHFSNFVELSIQFS